MPGDCLEVPRCVPSVRCVESRLATLLVGFAAFCRHRRPWSGRPTACPARPGSRADAARGRHRSRGDWPLPDRVWRHDLDRRLDVRRARRRLRRHRLDEDRQPHPERRLELLVRSATASTARVASPARRRFCRKHDLCWACPTATATTGTTRSSCKYRGAGSTLSFDFLSDSEPGYDFFTVEADSAGASEVARELCGRPECHSRRRSAECSCPFDGPAVAGVGDRAGAAGLRRSGGRPTRSTSVSRRTAATRTRTASTRATGAPGSSSTTSS